MKQKLTLQQIVELSEIMTKMAAMPKNPLKFCIARNARITDPIILEFHQKKDDIFNECVKFDGEGKPCILEDKLEDWKELKAKNKGIPFEFHEFNDKDDEKTFFNSLKKLLDEEMEVELITESLGRIIKVSNEDGQYTDCTIEAILEDPTNNIDINTISVFMKYLLVD